MKTVEFLEIFPKHFILIVLVLSFCVSKEWLCVCWYILCRILNCQIFLLCYVSHVVSSYFVPLSHLFISCMVDSFILASFSSPIFAYPTDVCSF